MDTVAQEESKTIAESKLDWQRISYLLLLSRAMDTIEERDLVPAKLVFNQFSARGHDLGLPGSARELRHAVMAT